MKFNLVIIVLIYFNLVLSRGSILCKDSSKYQLTKDITPENYLIKIKPNLTDFTFKGWEEIKIHIKFITNELILHGKDIDIIHANYVDQETNELTHVNKICECEEDDRIRFRFKSPIGPGTGHLRIKFTGLINEQLNGFYRTKYKAYNGDVTYGAVTQFESTDARKAFVCFDNPDMKATFDIILVVPNGFKGISNMPARYETHVVDEDGTKFREIGFETSPKMSTYLVAYAIVEFDTVEKITPNVIVRVNTPLHRSKEGLFALDVAANALNFLENYFKIAYPLPKMDLLCVQDFSAGAMENWGLVTYRETAILANPDNSSLEQKKYVAEVVSHELSHQWFGNLVTMKWWTQLWLNEGFATFMEFMSTDYLFPEFEIWMSFVADYHIKALELDELENSHPVEVPIEHPSQITEIFDTISYCKGAAILRMLHAWIGDENFRNGLHLYLSRHAYGNTCTRDLWDALADTTDKPIAEIMDEWTKKKGYPLIRVSLNRRKGSTIMTLTQEKITETYQSDNDEILWKIPITYHTNDINSKKKVLMTSRRMSVEVDLPSNGWIKINSDTQGYYRVAYPPYMLKKLIEPVRSKELGPLDRLNLNDDLFALARSGRISTVEYLKFMVSFINEDNYVVWNSIDKSLKQLRLLLSNTDYERKLYSFGRKLMGPHCKKLGWNEKDDEKVSDKFLRSLCITRLGLFKDPEIIKEAKKQFTDEISKKREINPELKEAIYIVAASDMNDEEFDQLFEIYKSTDNQEQKDRIASAMSSANSATTIGKVLKFAISDDVSLGDAPSLIGSIAGSLLGREMAWQFFKDNKELFIKRYSGDFLLSKLVKGCTQTFASDEVADEIKSYFYNKQFIGITRTVKQSIEFIRLKASWLKRDSASIETFLDSNVI